MVDKIYYSKKEKSFYKKDYKDLPQDALLVSEKGRKEIEEKQARIAEIKQELSSSDYKVTSDYDKPNEEIIKQRQSWREEIRELLGE